MNELSPVRSKEWNIYANSGPNQTQKGADKDTSLKDYGSTLNAISFGFVATAILVSMFLIMAIFEHLLRPKPPFSSSQDMADGSLESGHMQDPMQVTEKLGTSHPMSASYSSDFSVLMPGRHCPTFIAKPAPLPCSREKIQWPPHDQGFVPP